MERTKAVFNWSGGKDSAHALWHAIESQHYEIVALLTTVNHDTRRSTMHGIPFPLLQAQAASIGIPLHAVDLTPKGDMEDYQTAMSQAVAHFKAQGVTHFIFGDIFLHDFPHARPVPAGESFLPKLRHTSRRRHGENLHLLVRRSARAISHLYRRHFRWYALWLLPESAPHRTRLTEIRTNRRFRQPRKTYTYDNQNHPAPKNKPLLPITRTAGPGTPDSRMQRHPGK